MAGPASLWEFDGTWQLERRITDRSGAGDAELSGVATFRRSGETSIYDEKGTLHIDGQTGPIRATRRYIWRLDRDRISISFDDGRPFHAFPLGVDDPEATHLCAPDRYAVRYDFRDWPIWSAEWTVTGPNKDYTMLSRYARAA